MPHDIAKSNRQKRKTAYRARHRLLSIERDVNFLAQKCIGSELANSFPNVSRWPLIPNKQCGSWYLPPTSTITPVYFKSTDGHVGTYDFSLKRLNLHLIDVIHEHGGCCLVDSSVRKILPDSFSRTIPIWCCVINRIVQRYRDEMNICHNGKWDTNLYTPDSIVSSEEHAEILSLIDARVQLLYDSKAIVNPHRLIELLQRPLRAHWFTNGTLQNDTVENSCNTGTNDDEYCVILCYNPSSYSSDKKCICWVSSGIGEKEHGFYYTPGAADDDATWGRRLTHQLFWSNKRSLLERTLNDDDVDELIDNIVRNNIERDDVAFSHNKDSKCFMNKIGDLNLWIGSRKAGKPPDCWQHVDAILNVTNTEYPTMIESLTTEKDKSSRSLFYLMLPVAEGKKDKIELERWMPVGLCFLISHLQCGRKVLVHCAQGKDRSVAMVLALVVLLCPLEYPLRLRRDYDDLNLQTLETSVDKADDGKTNQSENGTYLQSGLSFSIVEALLKESGHDLFLKWTHQYSTKTTPLANKRTLRIGKSSNNH